MPIARHNSMRAFRAAVIAAFALVPASSFADQGGVSFWLPGSFGSLAATPLQPGWSWATIYLHSSVSAGGGVSASRAIRFGNRTANLNVELDATLNARADIAIGSPTYVFAESVLGGQLAVSVLGIYGRQQATIDANLNGSLGPIGFAASRTVSQALSAFGDVFVQPTLRWNNGVHNYMVYGMTNLPVGSYDSARLVNLGLGHWSIDGGAGYTYFNPQTGNEFSVVTGLTYNIENTSIDYRNGVDWHLDWGASHFLSKQFHVGVVGYAYQQLTADSGAGATLGDFKSRVFAVGPQVGFLFPVGDMQGYLNVKGYREFEAENRPEGWNMWVTFVLSPRAAEPPSAKPALRR